MTIHSRKPVLALFGTLAIAFVLVGMSHAAATHKSHAKAACHTKITMAQAEAAAMHKFPGKVAAKTQLENEEGVWQYGVMVKSGKTLREIMVNAKSGKIDSVEVTSATKEGIEAKADAAKEKATSKSPKQSKAKTNEVRKAK